MRKAFFITLLCALALPLCAQNPRGRAQIITLEDLSGRNRFAWEYDADFRYIFDNREFDASDNALIPSGTFNTLVFAPTVGFSVQQTPRIHHRISVGVELAHDMGSQTWNGLAREPLAWYDAHVRTGTGIFEGVAGIFPRRFLEGEYTEAFFSGMYRDTDRNLEGVLLKWRAQKFFAELGCDWMGQYGYARRERFQVISFGRWDAKPWLALGWTGSFYHYACSELAPNVVDNHLLEPWVKLDFSRQTQWEELSIRASLLAGYQRDRSTTTRYNPMGGDLILTARRWGLVLQNETFSGDRMLPLLGASGPDHQPYGTDLYFCSPCYSNFYDRIELAWIPNLTRYLSLRLAIRAHFGPYGYLGCQQQFSLRFSLDALRHRDIVSGRSL